MLGFILFYLLRYFSSAQAFGFQGFSSFEYSFDNLMFMVSVST
jgi:hypothetical protein